MAMEGYGLLMRFLLLGGLLIPVWTDLKKKRLSNKNLLFLFWTGLVLAAVRCMGQGFSSLSEASAGFFTGGGAGIFCYLFSRKGIGAGDVKLLAVVGLYLGAAEVLEVFSGAMLLAGCVCVFWLMTGRAGFGQKIPLAPFIWFAVLVSGARRVLL